MGIEAGVVAGTVRREMYGLRRLGRALAGRDRDRRVRRACGLLRRVLGPVLGAATTLLVVAAVWPAGGGASAGLDAGTAVTGSVRAQAAPAQAAPAQAAPAQAVTGQAALVPATVPVGSAALPPMAPVGRLLPADVLVVSPEPLPAGLAAALGRLRGVLATVPVDAAKVKVNGAFANVLGVDPVVFRRFAAEPTASNTALWSSVAAGDMAVSYTMGKQAKLPKGSLVQVAGRQVEILQVGGLGTVGVAGIDAVVSHAVAQSLGFAPGNGIIVSAPHASLSRLETRIKALVPATAAVEPLVVAATGNAGGAGAPAGSVGTGGLLSAVQVTAFLRAAVSRLGMPYVWGASGPNAFDCSGLVQWSFAQAGVAMPRVAADQARTGPAVPVSQLTPGDLLFYHTDPTAPGYISHVAIYLGSGRMIQAPQPGMNVEIVPVDLGSDFAGAVAVSPAVAAAAAGSPVG
jgi:peptidoglycan DL-endopeptidase CwlO